MMNYSLSLETLNLETSTAPDHLPMQLERILVLSRAALVEPRTYFAFWKLVAQLLLSLNCMTSELESLVEQLVRYSFSAGIISKISLTVE